MRVILLLLSLLATVMLQGGAAAQSPATAAEDAQTLDGIDRSMGDVERMLDWPWIWRSQLPELRSQLEGLEGKAKGLLEAATRSTDQQKGLLATLGPTPEANQGETAEIARTRQEISTLINAYESNQKHAKLVLAKSQSLKGRIAEIAGRLKTGELTTRSAPITDSALWASAIEEIRVMAGSLTGVWWADPAAAPSGPQHRAGAIAFMTMAGLVLYAVGFALWSGSAGRRAEQRGETALAIVIDLVRRRLPLALIPVAGAAILIYYLRFYGMLTEAEFRLLARAYLIVGLTIAGMAMASRLTAFVHPSGGRAAEPVGTLTFLVLMFGVFVFFDTTGREFVFWPNLFVVGKFLAGLAEVGLTVRLWRWAARWRAQGIAGRGASPRRRKGTLGWVAVRLLLMAAALSVLVHPLLFGVGYRGLGDWLHFGGFGTVALAMAVGYAFVIIADGVPVFVRRIVRPLILFWFRRALGRVNVQVLELGIQTVLAAGLAVATIVAASLVWALDPVQLLNWSEGVLSGINIGTYHLSVVDLATAVVIFGAIVLLTRGLQSGLEERVFRRVHLDAGAKNALKSGLGYFGLGIALLAALLALGIDLSRLALVAGALSVGIGFGLQTIVNNFLSGLLMLAERPIKVGDWVVINGYEGVVKRISVRATELQTFQMASVLIPNSEIISGTVTNWTFKDPTRRVDLRFGVECGADLDLVRKILLQCACAHPRVLRNPAPQALFGECGANALIFDLFVYIRIGEANKAVVESDLRTAIFRALREADIAITYPAASTPPAIADARRETGPAPRIIAVPR